MATVLVNSQPGEDFRQRITAGARQWLCDATVDEGGFGTNPEPHEYLLGALGACTAMTLQVYAQRRGWQLERVEVELSESQVLDPEQPGKHMSAITRDIRVVGSFSKDQLEALRRVADKCPIHKLITGRKTVSTTLSLRSEDAAA